MQRLSTLYDFHARLAVSPRAGVHVCLRSCEDPSKSITFFFAGDQGPARVQRLLSHMASLTDDQCDEYLNPERLKEKWKAQVALEKAERAARAEKQAEIDKQLKAQKAAEKERQRAKKSKKSAEPG